MGDVRTVRELGLRQMSTRTPKPIRKIADFRKQAK